MKHKCDKCERPATVHLTEIVSGKKLEKHFCEYCASEEKFTLQCNVPISQQLEQFLAQGREAEELSELVCDRCGMSFLEFRQGGLLGCPHDYEAFGSALGVLLQRAHEGADRHVGKVPRTAGQDEHRQNEMLRLRAGLKEALLREEYERAADIRDRIKELETS